MKTKHTNKFFALLLAILMVVAIVPLSILTVSAASDITTGNATVTAPVAGETPNFTAVSAEPDKYSVEVLSWTDKETSQELTSSDIFEGGKEYNVIVKFTAVGDNTLSFDNSFTINGNSTWWSGNGLKRGYTFTASGTGGGGTTDVYSATMSGVTFDSVVEGYTPITIGGGIEIVNTGNQTLTNPKVELVSGDTSAFYVGSVATVGSIGAGYTENRYYVRYVGGLTKGTYEATIQFTADNLPAPITATVKLTVGDSSEIMRSIVVSANNDTYGTVTGNNAVPTNTPATVTATANPGYVFVKWTEGGVEVSTDATYTFTVTADRNLVAVFEKEALNFADNADFDVADGYAGTAIDEINISSAVSGGTAPYTFSKESGPSWLNVSADGKITGTRPMTAQAATTATIKVTDGASASKTITIAIGAVSLKTINAIDFTLSGYAIGNTRYDASLVANTSGITLDDDGSINRYAFYTATDTKLGNYDAFEANTTYKIKVCYTVDSGYELGAAPTLTLGDATFVSNTKSGDYYTATFTLPQLEVATNNLTGITVTTPPTKTAYVVGENFDKTGMVVTATYEDSSTAPITSYTVTNGTALTAGQTTVTVSYTENMITKTATVTITVHEHTYGDTFNGKDATNHWKECTATDCPDKVGSKKDVTAHSESTPATCIAKATCACGQEIGDLGTHTFATDAWNEEVPATCVATGTKAHKDCSVCEKHFAADGVTEITDLTIAIDANNHDMATEWTKTAEGHYHSCKRTGCEYHDTLTTHTPDKAATTETESVNCTVCGYVITPALGHTTHTPKTEWKSDADNHWHECTGCEGQQLDKAAHVDSDTNGKCDTCDADVPVTPPHTHAHGTTWKSDANNHWNECECGDKANVAAHADTNNDEKCDTCGYDMPASGTEPGTEPGTTPGTDDPNTPDDPDKKDGLGACAIVAIVIGSVAVAGIGGFAIFWFVIKKKSWAELITAIKELWAKFLSLFKKN